ncbi:MAG: UvrD-helicase domain-containing protein [Candidatus Thiodiazotropha taylori]|nr:UvrD-helicase domain-containing protein [Candidatus Thiodiazotropha taylori]
MIDIPELTPALLDELGRELGGCDFSGPNQQAFLAATDSRDVQAAPGNGKTTLLVAKLALLSRTWQSRTQGVCVISHTNAARKEVEEKLHGHPSASAFLSYPHFIGTVTSFIDRFIALPYLRGLGWTVQHIDDDVFAAVALSRWRTKQPLTKYAYRNEYALRRYLKSLELADDFECDENVLPARLKVRPRPRQPGPASATGIALEELKAEIVNDGYYRYGDMLALATQALEKCPTIVERLRRRFPLVLLDEAQDTNGVQLALLEKLFGEGIAYQRLGDQNQTLYEDEELGPDDYWRAAEDVIPLNQTRRFGTDIANFSSRLTARTPQEIESLIDRPGRRILILFDDFEIRNVLKTYATEVRGHWGGELRPSLDIRAVASRHSPTRDTTGGWPKTLVDYCPTYQGGSSHTQMRSNLLCVGLRYASALHHAQSSPAEIADLLKSSIVRLLRCQNVLTEEGRPVTRRNLWSVLRQGDASRPLLMQRLFRDNVICGTAPWAREEWIAFSAGLLTVLGIDGEPTEACTAFLRFVPYKEENEEDAQVIGQHSNVVFEHDGVHVRLGSIHSVKGKTVDAILALETEVYRGRALADRAMDLATVLPHAFGLEELDFSASQVELAAATNIFVAATRPRHVLALAMRREVASDILIAVAKKVDG